MADKFYFNREWGLSIQFSTHAYVHVNLEKWASSEGTCWETGARKQLKLWTNREITIWKTVTRTMWSLEVNLICLFPYCLTESKCHTIQTRIIDDRETPSFPDTLEPYHLDWSASPQWQWFFQAITTFPKPPTGPSLNSPVNNTSSPLGKSRLPQRCSSTPSLSTPTGWRPSPTFPLGLPLSSTKLFIYILSLLPFHLFWL